MKSFASKGRSPLGGVFRGGRVDVDAVSWPDDRGYRNDRDYRYDDYRDDYVRGIVERIDYRSGVLLLRDASTRRTIEVDMRDTRRSSRIDLGDLRRGDSVTLSGQWLRGGRFEADGIESVNSAATAWPRAASATGAFCRWC